MKPCLLNLFFARLALLSLIPIVIGCGPQLSTNHEVTLEPNDIQSILLDPVNRAQVIKVVAISDGTPIHVHVYLAEDEQAVDDAIALGKSSDKVIASRSHSKQISLEALIPAGKQAAIRLQPANSATANVNLTVTNY